MPETITVRTEEGESKEIKLEELSTVKKMLWGARAPPELVTGQVGLSERGELMEWAINLLESETPLSRDIMNDLSVDELSNVIEKSLCYLFSGKLTVDESSANDYKIDDIDFGDGSVDLEDWR
jgi:hypothetical protein